MTDMLLLLVICAVFLLVGTLIGALVYVLCRYWSIIAKVGVIVTISGLFLLGCLVAPKYPGAGAILISIGIAVSTAWAVYAWLKQRLDERREKRIRSQVLQLATLLGSSALQMRNQRQRTLDEITAYIENTRERNGHD